MHIPDLELVKYHNGAFDADNWPVPLRAVGWLEHPQRFASGVVPTAAIIKLKSIVEQMRAAYPHYGFRGVKDCSLCLAAGLPSPGPIWSQENIFVPGACEVYVAPGGIIHYIEAHSYLPPTQFLESVSTCPDCRSNEYQEALRSANKGVEPPLESHQSFSLRISKMGRRP